MSVTATFRCPIVTGRDAERFQIGELLLAARAGRGGALALEGEAGVGKSRLAAFAAQQASDRGMRVLVGRAVCDEAFRLGGEVLVNQPQRRSHVCYETATGFSVLDIWESEDAFAAFGEVLGPYLAKTGLAPVPQVHQVHQTITPSGERGE